MGEGCDHAIVSERGPPSKHSMSRTDPALLGANRPDSPNRIKPLTKPRDALGHKLRPRGPRRRPRSTAPSGLGGPSDETDEHGRTPAGRAAQSRPDPWRSSDHLHALLRPLCAATDALARLDARAAAAGWLAHTHAWIHPLDLALREAGLSASTALAALGAGHRARPQAFAGEADHRDWADPRLDAMADGNRVVAEALALARVLRRLPGKTGTNPFADATEAAEALHALGAGVLDPNRLADWWQARPPWPPVRGHRLGGRDGEGVIRRCQHCWTSPARHKAGWRPVSPIARRPPARCSLPPAGSPATVGCGRCPAASSGPDTQGVRRVAAHCTADGGRAVAGAATRRIGPGGDRAGRVSARSRSELTGHAIAGASHAAIRPR
jgi:hypothetical protein